jgi:putative endonuclease
MPYYVYILTNKSNRVLYTGVTNNIQRRLYEHKNKLISGFTAKYNVDKVVYLEEFDTSIEAITANKSRLERSFRLV